MSKRNSLLELWRFVFCMAVLFFHFFIKARMDYFHAGYLGVEFFLIVSGYFVASYYQKHAYKQTWNLRFKSIFTYAWSRLVRLYPLYLLALILMLLVQSIISWQGFRNILQTIKNCYAEFILLQWSAIGNEVLISAGWFVPAVFFAGVIFLAILVFTGKIGGYVIAPLTSFFIYRYYFNLIGKIDVIYAHHSIIRGIAGISLGVFIYYMVSALCKLIQQPRVRSIYSWASATCSSLILLGIFIYTNYGRRSKWDFLIIALYAISILLLMSSQIKLPEKVEKVFSFLGKTTYPIYVLQMPIIELIILFIK